MCVRYKEIHLLYMHTLTANMHFPYLTTQDDNHILIHTRMSWKFGNMVGQKPKTVKNYIKHPAQV